MEVNINDTLITLDCLQKRREKNKKSHIDYVNTVGGIQKLGLQENV
jgi:hypothetical protein